MGVFVCVPLRNVSLFEICVDGRDAAAATNYFPLFLSFCLYNILYLSRKQTVKEEERACAAMARFELIFNINSNSYWEISIKNINVCGFYPTSEWLFPALSVLYYEFMKSKNANRSTQCDVSIRDSALSTNGPEYFGSFVGNTKPQCFTSLLENYKARRDWTLPWCFNSSSDYVIIGILKFSGVGPNETTLTMPIPACRKLTFEDMLLWIITI